MFEYNRLGRLVTEKRDDGDNGSFERNISYGYDSDGNRVGEFDNNNHANDKRYLYEGQSSPNDAAISQRLVKIQKLNPVQDLETYTWTANGELATKTTHATGEVQTNVWGLDGTLIGTGFEGGANDGVEIVYEYDHEQTLIARKVYRDGNLEDHERYLVDNNNLTGYSQILAVLDVKGSVRRYHDFADEIKSQTTFDAENSTAQPRQDLLLTDALGSVRGLTTTSGGVAQSTAGFNYTAFGSLLTGNRSLTSYAFTGQYADPLSQLQYHRARWLDTGLRQWTANDPVFDFPENYGSSFGYASSDPLNSRDYNGKTEFSSPLNKPPFRLFRKADQFS